MFDFQNPNQSRRRQDGQPQVGRPAKTGQVPAFTPAPQGPAAPRPLPAPAVPPPKMDPVVMPPGAVTPAPQTVSQPQQRADEVAPPLGNLTPAGAPVGPPPQPNDIQTLLDEYIKQQIRAGLGTPDTSEQEALIRELTQQKAGKDLANGAASMGRAGFASSGASAAMGSDIRRAAGQAAAQEIFGVRNDERDRATANANAAAGIKNAEEQAANQGTLLDTNLQVIKSLLGDSGGGDPLAPPDAAPRDQNDDGHTSSAESAAANNADREAAREKRQAFVESHESADLGAGHGLRNPDGTKGDDIPGHANNPYVTTTAERRQMEESGFEFTPLRGADGEPILTVYGEKILYDQYGNAWLIRNGT